MPFVQDAKGNLFYDDAIRQELRRAWNEAMKEDSSRKQRKQKQARHKKEAKAEEERLIAEAIQEANKARAALPPKDVPPHKKAAPARATVVEKKPPTGSALGACIQEALSAAKTSAGEQMMDYVQAIVSRVNLDPCCDFCNKTVGKKKVQRCTCGTVEYCSLTCQRLHWECHRILCRPALKKP